MRAMHFAERHLHRDQALEIAHDVATEMLGLPAERVSTSLIYVAVTSRLRNFWRSRERRASAEGAYQQMRSTVTQLWAAPEAELEIRELQERIQAVVAGMPSGMREVFVLIRDSSGAALISKEDMLRLLGVLDRGGFLATAESFYSEATDKHRGPPPASNDYKVYAERVQKSPGSEIRLNSHDDNYHTYYIILPSWDKQLVPLLTELRGTISDSSRKSAAHPTVGDS